jgi:hypothetical protein
VGRERLWADGWEITQDTSVGLELRDGLNDRAAGKRGDNVAVVGQHGTIWVPKPFDESEWTCNLWTADQSRTVLDTTWDNVVRALVRGHRLVTFVYQKADGTQRQCLGEVIEAADPKHTGQQIVEAAFAVRVPGAFWTDTADTTVATLAGAAIPQSQSVFPLATAPMDDLKYKIDGPISGPSLMSVDIYTGQAIETFNYNGTLGVGQSLTVDAANWNVIGGGGHNASMAGVGYTGRNFLTLHPGPPGQAALVRLYGSNPGATTRLTVTGRASYQGP